MLTNAELEEHPDNIEGLEGLDPTWEIDYNDLEFGNELARGNFGAVSVAEYLGTKVAVKRLFDLDDDMKIYLQRELNVLKQIRHPNIVQFLGLSKTDEGLYLITEFVERGDLCRLLYDPRVTELDSWLLRTRICTSAAQGLAYLHAKSLIHRDIKAANFLVGENWTIKLCDFGFSRSTAARKGGGRMDAGNVMTLCGTDEWMAPETIMGLDYDASADVFSFAMFLTETILRAEPEQRSPSNGFRFNVAKFKRAVPKTCPDELVQLALDGTTYDAEKRPLMKTMLRRLQVLSKTYQDPEPEPTEEPEKVAPAAPGDSSSGDSGSGNADANGHAEPSTKKKRPTKESKESKESKDKDKDRITKAKKKGHRKDKERDGERSKKSKDEKEKEKDKDKEKRHHRRKERD